LPLLLITCRNLTETTIKHPDSPMLVTDYSWLRGAVRVSVYNSYTGELQDYDWVDLSMLPGWTISKYDWDRYLTND
jgi:hypothetical protein